MTAPECPCHTEGDAENFLKGEADTVCQTFQNTHSGAKYYCRIRHTFHFLFEKRNCVFGSINYCLTHFTLTCILLNSTWLANSAENMFP